MQRLYRLPSCCAAAPDACWRSCQIYWICAGELRPAKDRPCARCGAPARLGCPRTLPKCSPILKICRADQPLGSLLPGGMAMHRSARRAAAARRMNQRFLNVCVPPIAVDSAIPQQPGSPTSPSSRLPYRQSSSVEFSLPASSLNYYLLVYAFGMRWNCIWLVA